MLISSRFYTFLVGLPPPPPHRLVPTKLSSVPLCRRCRQRQWVSERASAQHLKEKPKAKSKNTHRIILGLERRVKRYSEKGLPAAAAAVLVASQEFAVCLPIAVMTIIALTSCVKYVHPPQTRRNETRAPLVYHHLWWTREQPTRIKVKIADKRFIEGPTKKKKPTPPTTTGEILRKCIRRRMPVNESEREMK